MADKVEKSDEEWRKELTPMQFEVTRKKATEAPYTGEYDKAPAPGIYRGVYCGETLFASDAKFDAGCGWHRASQSPSAKAASRRKWIAITARSARKRSAPNYDAHLVHVFRDEPEPTGLRYCVNSAALKHEPKK